MGLFKEISVYNTITKKESQIMGDIFDSKMPEEHYQSEISDLKCKLDHVESLLTETMVHIDQLHTNSRLLGVKVQKYIDKLETDHN